MNMDAVDELRALRARAYGPDADIHADAVAIQRLLELEHHASQTPDAAEPGDLAEEDAATANESPGAPSGLETAASVAPPPRRAVNRRALLWAATLIVVLVTAWAATVLIQRVQSDPLQTGAEQVTRLGVDPRFVVPAALNGSPTTSDETRGYDEFYGLRPFLSPGWAAQDSDDVCLVLLDSESATETHRGFSGPIFVGCPAGGFPAIAQFVVTDELPDELLREFPEGAALQFVLDEDADEVVVFSDVK